MYLEEENQVNLKLQVNQFKAKLTYTYPKYSKNDWIVIVYPNGNFRAIKQQKVIFLILERCKINEPDDETSFVMIFKTLDNS